MTPQAHIIHQIRGRVRLRIKAKRQDAEFFEAVHGQLTTLQGIEDVRVNSDTGSIVLVHPEIPYSALETQLQTLDLFEMAAGPEAETPVIVPLISGISKVNQKISELSSGRIDLLTLVIMGAVALAIRQSMRGDLLGPALPLLWSAVELAIRISRSRADATPDTTTLEEP